MKHSDELDAFSNLVTRVLSVSKTEMLRCEAEYQKQAALNPSGEGQTERSILPLAPALSLLSWVVVSTPYPSTLHTLAAGNHPENGLLLRSDIHTLFDLDLLGIEPDRLQVELHPSLTEEYGDLAGMPLGCGSGCKPSHEALKLRYKLFQRKLGRRCQ